MWMSRRQQVWINPLVACIGGLLAVWVYGFGYGVANNEYHVMIVSRISEGLTWPGDLLTPTIDRYASLLWPLVGRVATVVPEPTAFLLFFIGARVLFVAGLTALILAFWDTSRLKALVTGTLLSLLPGFLLGLPLGDDGAFGYYLSQTFVSLGFCLVSIGAAVTGRPLLAGLACGAAFASNVMQGCFAAALLVALGGHWAVSRLRSGASIGGAYSYLLRFGLAALPLLGLAAYQLYATHAHFVSTTPSLEGQALADFAKFHWTGHHFWMLKSGAERLEGLALPMSLAAMALTYRQRTDDVGRRAGATLMVSAGVFLSLIALEALIGSYLPSRTQLAAHWFRSDVLAFCVGSAALTTLVVAGWEARDESIHSLLLALVAFMHVLFVPAAMLLLIVAFDRSRRNSSEARGSLTVSCALCVAGAAALTGLRFLGLSATMPAILMSLAALGYFCRIIGTWERVVVAVAAGLFAVTVVRNHSRVNRSGQEGEDWRTPHQMREFGRTVQRMVPRDGLLLVPTHSPGSALLPTFRVSDDQGYGGLLLAARVRDRVPSAVGTPRHLIHAREALERKSRRPGIL